MNKPINHEFVIVFLKNQITDITDIHRQIENHKEHIVQLQEEAAEISSRNGAIRLAIEALEKR